MKKRIPFLIVLYNPSKSSLSRILNLSATFDLYVFDNSNVSQDYLLNTDLLTYGRPDTNVGISGALIWISRKLESMDLHHFVFFDQDTIFDEGAILRIQEISANYEDFMGLVHYTSDLNKEKNPRFIINSGTLYNVAFLKPLIPKLRHYFVDAIDTFLSVEARRKKHQIIVEFVDGIDHTAEQGYEVVRRMGIDIEIKEYSNFRISEFYGAHLRLLFDCSKRFEALNCIYILKMIVAFTFGALKVKISKL